MSTISPLVSQKVGKALAAKSVRMLDAPVSGGEKGAMELDGWRSLARNVVVNGFQGGSGKPTEFLILLNWYMDQARELMAFAGPGGVIHISTCAEAKPLLPILGYRMKESCGPNAAVETTNADRAFLTIDSGFPLSELEETMRGGEPFNYPFASTRVPVLFGGNEWAAAEKNEKNGKKDLVDALLRDPGMARLYWAMCAAQALGAVPVPIYADSVAEEMAYILQHAEVTIAARYPLLRNTL